MSLSGKIALLTAVTAMAWGAEPAHVAAWDPLAAVSAPTVPPPAPPPGLPKDILTNQGVITLAEAGFSDSFIAEKIRLSRSRFDTSAEGLAELRRHEISEELIQFLLRVSARPVPLLAPEAKKGLLSKLPFGKKTDDKAAAPQRKLPARPVLNEPAGMVAKMGEN